MQSRPTLPTNQSQSLNFELKPSYTALLFHFTPKSINSDSQKPATTSLPLIHHSALVNLRKAVHHFQSVPVSMFSSSNPSGWHGCLQAAKKFQYSTSNQFSARMFDDQPPPYPLTQVQSSAYHTLRPHNQDNNNARHHPVIHHG